MASTVGVKRTDHAYDHTAKYCHWTHTFVEGWNVDKEDQADTP